MTVCGNDGGYAIVVREFETCLGFGWGAVSRNRNASDVVRAVEFSCDHAAVTPGFTGWRGGRMGTTVDRREFVPSYDIGSQEEAHLVLPQMVFFAICERFRFFVGKYA
jgi:phosphoheptose isomerase